MTVEQFWAAVRRLDLYRHHEIPILHVHRPTGEFISVDEPNEMTPE
jgi:hypothetical protein